MQKGTIWYTIRQSMLMFGTIRYYRIQYGTVRYDRELITEELYDT